MLTCIEYTTDYYWLPKNDNNSVIYEIAGKDAAGIASEAINFARDAQIDVVMIDTAGRMQDNEPLMRALAKVTLTFYCCWVRTPSNFVWMIHAVDQSEPARSGTLRRGSTGR